MRKCIRFKRVKTLHVLISAHFDHVPLLKGVWDKLIFGADLASIGICAGMTLLDILRTSLGRF